MKQASPSTRSRQLLVAGCAVDGGGVGGVVGRTVGGVVVGGVVGRTVGGVVVGVIGGATALAILKMDTCIPAPPHITLRSPSHEVEH